jgi:hypothetical protein
MNSRSLLLLAFLVGCADLERGPRPPGPDATPDVLAADGGASRDAIAAADAGLSFASVRPLIDDQCARCHVAGGMAGNTTFLLTGDATEEYMAVRALVDVTAPAQSRLLAKASGMSHQGGVIYRTSSPEYAALLAWIQAGAAP